MERILLFGVVMLIATQFVITCTIRDSTDYAFGHYLGDVWPTPFALFLMFVPGSFVILLVINCVVVPMISAVKFVINFVPNKLKKKKFERKMLFDAIETKYVKLVGKLYR